MSSVLQNKLLKHSESAKMSPRPRSLGGSKEPSPSASPDTSRPSSLNANGGAISRSYGNSSSNQRGGNSADVVPLVRKDDDQIEISRLMSLGMTQDA
jgi:hypothetical protein